MTVTNVNLLESMRRTRILDQGQLAEAESLSLQLANPSELTGRLQDRGWLSTYQAETILKGKADSLILGPYTLVETVGEGGMGQVFKAVHRILKSVRAVKVIRDECLTNKLAIDRFHREIELVSRLKHPNIVMAHDAGQHNDTHYFVMEFVSGIDLSKLIRQRSSLPVSAACECIRQAALGLQHAFEKGLVHRDIKPSNLLLCREEGVVKILDMGLARLRDAPAAPAGSSADSPLTPSGAVMGTPDYMAPEQAEDSRVVDTRADIYALGCSLYQLLTGQLPFPGGGYVEKLIKHRFENPEPIGRFRTDVPPDVITAVDRMMAKSPADRYQTPAEVAQVLRPFCRPLDLDALLFGGESASANTPDTHNLGAESSSHVPDTLAGQNVLHPSELASRLDPTFSRVPSWKGTSKTDIMGPNSSTAPESKTAVVTAPPLAPPARSSLRFAVPLGIGLVAGIGIGLVLLFKTPKTSSTSTSVGSENTSTTTRDPAPYTFVGPLAPLGIGKSAREFEGTVKTPPKALDIVERSLSHLEDVHTLQSKAVKRIVFSGDGSRMALNLGEVVQILETESGKMLHTIEVKPLVRSPVVEERRAGTIALSHDGKALLIATISQPTDEMITSGAKRTEEFDVVVLWQEGSKPRLFYGNNAQYIDKIPHPVTTKLSFAGLDARFALAVRPQNIVVWDLSTTRAPYGTLPIKNAGVFVATLDGKYALASGLESPLVLSPLMRDSSRPIGDFTGTKELLLALAVGDNSRLVLAADLSGQLCGYLWPDLSNATVERPVQVSPAWSDKGWTKGTVSRLAIGPQKENPLFITFDAERRLTLGRAKLGEKTIQMERLLTETLPEGESVHSMQFAPDGQSVWIGTSRRVARLWVEPLVPLTPGKTRDPKGVEPGLAK